MITAAEYEVKGRVDEMNRLSPLTRNRISDHMDEHTGRYVMSIRNEFGDQHEDQHEDRIEALE
jgi:hypothetical protein